MLIFTVLGNFFFFFFFTWDWFLMDESNLKKLHLHCINQGMQR